MAPPCPVCGRDGPAEAAARLQHVLFRCPHCRLLYSERVGDPHALVRYYQKGEENYFDLPYFQRHQKLEEHPEYGNYREALSRVRSAGTSPERLLDVGCGMGVLLETAKTLGFEAEGLEISGTPTPDGEFVVHRYDGNVDLLPAMEPFDVIVLWDVLEHLAAPAETLAKLKPLLQPGGRFLIRTVNEDCLLSSWSLAWMRWGLCAPARRMHEFYHVVYFTEKTLNICLEQAGLRPLQRWSGEFPVERASRNPFVRLALRGAYLLQGITDRTFEQYVIASSQSASP